MTRVISTNETREEPSLLNWKAMFAGLVVTIAVYSLLLFLGVGVGASAARETIQEGGNFGDLGQSTGVWITVSTLVALGVGGFFAARTSTFFSRSLGAAQGLVIASLFLVLMSYGVGQTVGSGLSGMASAITSGTSGLASSPMVQTTVEDALADVPLKSDTTTVVKGVVSRLLSGNSESAKAYLAAQTGLPPAEMEQRFTEMEAQFKATVQSAGIETADAVSKSGYAMFWISLLGILCACGGGALGAQANRKRPLVRESRPVEREFSARPAV